MDLLTKYKTLIHLIETFVFGYGRFISTFYIKLEYTNLCVTLLNEIKPQLNGTYFIVLY